MGHIYGIRNTESARLRRVDLRSLVSRRVSRRNLEIQKSQFFRKSQFFLKIAISGNRKPRSSRGQAEVKPRSSRGQFFSCRLGKARLQVLGQMPIGCLASAWTCSRPTRKGFTAGYQGAAVSLEIPGSPSSHSRFPYSQPIFS